MLAFPAVGYATVASPRVPVLTAWLTILFPVYSCAFLVRAIYVYFRYKKLDGSLILIALPALCSAVGVAVVALAQSSRAVDSLLGFGSGMGDDLAILISAAVVFLSPFISLGCGLRLRLRNDNRWKMLVMMSLVNIAVISTVVAAYVIPRSY